MSEIRRVFVTTQMPNRRNPTGAVEEGHFKVEGDVVYLVNANGSARLNSEGKPIKRPMASGETEHEVAHWLTRQHIPNRRSDFNRRLHYWDRGKI